MTSNTSSDEGTYCVVMRAPSRLVIDPGEALHVTISSQPARPVSLVIFTNHVDEGHAVAVPRELVVQARGLADSLDNAIASFYLGARPFGDVLAFCGNASVGMLEPHIAWDDTPGRSERQFMEVYLRDERGLPLPGRRLRLSETRAVLRLMARMPEEERSALVGIMSRYGVALGTWYLGGETAAFPYLWFAVEALAKLVVSREIRADAGSVDAVADRYGMPRTGGVSVRSLEAFMRRRWVFANDAVLHDEARDLSDGLEHASLPLAEAHPKSAALAPAVFLALRRGILRGIDPGGTETAGLLAGRTALPLDTIQRRIVKGCFVDVSDQLAHPDLLYPLLEWRPRVDSLTRSENGDYGITFSDKLTVRCAPDVGFKLSGYEMRGRPDGSAGAIPTVAGVTPGSEA